MRKEYSLFAIGIALAGAGVSLAVTRPGIFTPALAYLPEIYATALACYFFYLRARQVSGRERTFWQFWAAGCALWLVNDLFGILAWSMPLHSGVGFISLTFMLLPELALMGALVLQPEETHGELWDPVVPYEAALVVLWWLYLYLMFVTPWRWDITKPAEFWSALLVLHKLQDTTLVIWLVGLAISSRGRWRSTYLHLAVGAGLLLLALRPLYQAWRGASWFPAMIFDTMIACAFLWLALAPFTATGKPVEERPPSRTAALAAGSVLASLTAFGIPMLAIWSQFLSSAPGPVRRFRLLISFVTLTVGVLLVFQRQDVADRQGERLVDQLEFSVAERRRLQGHFAEAEKLVSLGHLAAGAAHEINNPVAAMLGYSELLRVDPAASERSRELAQKIGEQARRIRNLVQNLLSLGEHESRKPEPVDVAMLLRNAAELRLMGGRHRNDTLRIDVAGQPLEVRGEADRLLQVFYRLLLALSRDEPQRAVDVRTQRNDSGWIIVDFAGRPVELATRMVPEVYDAQQAQEGTGFSFSVCKIIIKEHGGSILHEKLSDRQHRFRVELPAITPRSAAAPDPAAEEPPLPTGGSGKSLHPA